MSVSLGIIEVFAADKDQIDLSFLGGKQRQILMLGRMLTPEDMNDFRRVQGEPVRRSPSLIPCGADKFASALRVPAITQLCQNQCQKHQSTGLKRH